MSETATETRLDPLTLGVVWRSLAAAANDAGTTLQRTAYSEAVRESRDFSVGLFDHEARMIAQGDFSPGHLGSMPNVVKSILDYYPLEDLRPGDCILLNDAWLGSGHLPDFFLATPAFLDDRIIGYTVCCVHMIDVGGAVPGSQAVEGIVDYYQEGIRMVPVRVWRAGEPNVEVLRMIETNVRVPDKLLGDLKAMRNCNRIGEQRLQALVEQFGRETYETACEEILERSETAMRESIAEIPDGVYHAVDYFDDCGPDTEPLRIEVTVTISGDELTVSFAGSSPQTRSGINGVAQWVRAWCFFAVKVLTHGFAVPQNAGCLRPVHWDTPQGTVVSAERPVGTGARAVMLQRIVDVLMQAFSTALPDKVLAASSQWGNPVIGGVDPRNGRPFVLYDIITGGLGAFSYQDGEEALSPAFNVDSIPAEIHEHAYPVMIERYELIRDEAGAGTYRGGRGVRKDMRLLGEHMRLMNLTDRQKFAAPGLFGGGDGSLGRTVLNPGGDERVLHSKGTYSVDSGDVVSTRLGSGGGYGDPFKRDPALVAVDVRLGYLTPDAARETYGVEVDADGQVDAQATGRLRGE